jgi:hypothetical protein
LPETYTITAWDWKDIVKSFPLWFQSYINQRAIRFADFRTGLLILPGTVVLDILDQCCEDAVNDKHLYEAIRQDPDELIAALILWDGDDEQSFEEAFNKADEAVSKALTDVQEKFKLSVAGVKVAINFKNYRVI